MKPTHRRRLSFSSSSSSTVVYALRNDQPAPPSSSTQVPVQSSGTPIPITLHVPQSTAAVKIQSAYRSHLIRNLYKTIAAVHSEADEFRRLIQSQDTVDAVRSSEREKLKVNEALMKLLLKLDSVPGVDPTVREARRKVSRRIVGLQEIVDAIVQVDVDGFWGSSSGGFGRDYWNDVVAEMVEEVCRERGGEEMERFCAEHLGFRCLQRFLSQP
ncbi:BAG family molecular chaperone regulator 5, mitochondrial [Argentina anserina]|uniref:BAG family molecular chaperone regulator 5, mitochondrial n=1 Tax=Argentina anserina TaxID=57926 RepID=UPI00217690CC|nr:BAG family molecular chaperone regulator 5, mitochondrial [Potentilla anserina]